MLIWRAPEAPHHLYAVEFTNGIVKVGRSVQPKTRIRQLARDARRLVRVDVVREYIAPNKLGWPRADHAERELCDRLARIGNLCRGKAEFFSHTKFEIARQLCEQIAGRA